MRINNNISALNTYNKLSVNTNNGSKALEKLSSGLRINRAGDDAAGLAISEKMRGQIRGLEQASRNAQDGISMIQTGEGALNETQSILQRMRELAVQAANDTNTGTDRQEIQKEITQLKSEINRIASDTEFNTKKLLNGDLGLRFTATANAANFDVNASLASESNLESGSYTFGVTGVTRSLTVTQASAGLDNGEITIRSVAGSALKVGTYTLDISGASGSANIVVKNANGETVLNATAANLSTAYTLAGTVRFTAAQYAQIPGQTASLKFNVGLSGTVGITNPAGSTTNYGVVTADTESQLNVGGFEIAVNTSLVSGSTVLQVTNNAVYFQLGANQNQTTKLAFNKMDTAALQVASVDVTTQTGAQQAITFVSSALEKVSGERAKLGAIQNRLEHTINNLGTSAENLTASESRIRDVDMAKEMMNFTKNNILTQAAQAMLAQANQAPQGVLQLLR